MNGMSTYQQSTRFEKKPVTKESERGTVLNEGETDSQVSIRIFVATSGVGICPMGRNIWDYVCGNMCPEFLWSCLQQTCGRLLGMSPGSGLSQSKIDCVAPSQSVRAGSLQST